MEEDRSLSYYSCIFSALDRLYSENNKEINNDFNKIYEKLRENLKRFEFTGHVLLLEPDYIIKRSRDRSELILDTIYNHLYDIYCISCKKYDSFRVKKIKKGYERTFLEMIPQKCPNCLATIVNPIDAPEDRYVLCRNCYICIVCYADYLE